MMELPLIDNGIPTVRLRGHTLLCLQGFRGLGYSPGFVDNLARIHRELVERPETIVEVVDAPDVICGACPHETATGCALNGRGTESGMQEQDRLVLRRLGLQAGERLSWEQVLERIGGAISGEDLPTLCGQCRWLPLGWCREGIERLRGRP